jgi:HD-like signal output (HDOD) protein
MSAAVAAVLDKEINTEVVSDEAAQLVKDIGIPPCPAVLIDFSAEMNKDDPDFRRLSHLINKDVALAASVLKTVNSPFYGLAKKATTVQDALTLLGLRQTSRLVAGLMLRQAFASSKSPAMVQFWDGSAKTALIAGYLARELGAAKLEEAHTFTLFRDCGVPVLLTRFPDYEELLSTTRMENELRRSEIERIRYGFDHALVSATLAQSWHLPRDMWQAIRMHNQYERPGFDENEGGEKFARWIALALLAEQLHRIHRSTYSAEEWVTEDAFIERVIGPVKDRLDPLANDITRILQQT